MDRGEGRADSLLTHSAPEQYEEQSEGVEDVVGRHPEHELEIEGVELRDEEENRDAEDRHPPLEARQRVPRELNPAVRRKLTNEGSVLIGTLTNKGSVLGSQGPMSSNHLAEESFDFAPESGNLIQSSPVIFSHSEISGNGN